MSLEAIISLIVLGVVILAGLITIVVAIVRGEMKKFIIAKMEEAENLKLDGLKKLQYVLEAVKEKYKLMELFLNVKKFVESIIEISKKINYKK